VLRTKGKFERQEELNSAPNVYYDLLLGQGVAPREDRIKHPEIPARDFPALARYLH
jgi:hypothetical protein